ncbi:MAG: recombinase family protein [Oscillospiraceae bacterium]|nr:recombinase family protein [Oscillospiraceae bacterium]
MKSTIIPEAAMYLRKSRAEELTDTTAEVLARHREILEALARRQSIVVSDVYEEVVSGESIAKRPQMQQLLSAVKSGRYGAVLCMDIDRLGRGNMQDQGALLEIFQRSETLIVTPDKTYDLTDEIDEELTEFKAFFARREWKSIRKRMRRGLMQTIEGGGYIANEPYGYKKIRVGKPPNDMPTLEIVPEEAKFIRHIFSRYLQGVGAATISAELNAMGSVPRRNAEWSRSTVRQILRNPTFKGYVAWNRVKHYRPGDHGLERQHVVYMPEDEWILVKGLHQPIVSEEDWNAVQDIRKRKFIPSQKTGHTMNSLAGLVTCSTCGMKMQRMGSRGGEVRLNCNTKGCCASARHEYVEEALIAALCERLPQLRLEAAALDAPVSSSDAELIAGLDRELEKVSQRLPKLYTLFEDGVYDLDTFRARKAAADSELAALTARREDVAQRVAIRESQDLTAAADELENVLQLWPVSDAERRNQLLKSILVEVKYYKAKKTKPRDFTLEITPLHFIW